MLLILKSFEHLQPTGELFLWFAITTKLQSFYLGTISTSKNLSLLNHMQHIWNFLALSKFELFVNFLVLSNCGKVYAGVVGLTPV